ncbi:hypothetical protein PIB30_054621 [Stylosanthes scabra]|uniref:Uncharacterized protein n=1 Tax=Stylosanthes scabra TaxID=79078 RepID=A0ABU6TK23_9FABA|nr:hypothetical protein [Stylosanthes scabra]
MLEEADRDAVLANVAIRDGINKGYNVIVEIACILSPQELFAMRHAYQNRYKRSLEEDLAANTSSLLRQGSEMRERMEEEREGRGNEEFGIWEQNWLGNGKHNRKPYSPNYENWDRSILASDIWKQLFPAWSKTTRLGVATTRFPVPKFVTLIARRMVEFKEKFITN